MSQNHRLAFARLVWSEDDVGFVRTIYKRAHPFSMRKGCNRCDEIIIKIVAFFASFAGGLIVK